MKTTFIDPNIRALFLQESNELLAILRDTAHKTVFDAVETHAEAVRQAFAIIETLEAELRTKNDELHTLRFIGQTPEHLDVQPGALQIVPGPPTLIQRIKAAIAALKGK